MTLCSLCGHVGFVSEATLAFLAELQKKCQFGALKQLGVFILLYCSRLSLYPHSSYLDCTECPKFCCQSHAYNTNKVIRVAGMQEGTELGPVCVHSRDRQK